MSSVHDLLVGFDPKMTYPAVAGMEVMTRETASDEALAIAWLLTEMALAEASEYELARAIRHSMVIIDAEKHLLNFRQSEIDNAITQLKIRYQTTLAPPTVAVSNRPWLVTYSGVRVDNSEVLWTLYETIVKNENEHEVYFAKKALYGAAGSGGWDDVCRDCPKHRYEHAGVRHPFISEEQ